MGKKSSPPPPPDYRAQAEATAAANAEATRKQTEANRPNQIDAYGNTSTWSQDPTTGQWTQKQSLSDANQALLDQQQAMRSQVMGQATDAIGKPVDLSGLQDYSNYDFSQLQGVNPDSISQDLPTMGDLKGGGLFNMDPMGNAKEIQDATYGLLTPQREMARNSEIQRLKNQGLTEDSPAFQRAVTRLDQGDTEAQLRSLLAGQTEYGNQFQRALAENQSNFGQNLNTANFANASNQQKFGQNQAQQQLALALRGQQFNEQTGNAQLDAAIRAQQLSELDYQRNAPLTELERIMQLQSLSNPQFGNFVSAGNAGGTDYTGAAKSSYDADVGNVNAKNQQAANTTNGLVGLAGTAMMAFAF